MLATLLLNYKLTGGKLNYNFMSGQLTNKDSVIKKYRNRSSFTLGDLHPSHLFLLQINHVVEFGFQLVDLIHLFGVVLLQLPVLLFFQLLQSLELSVKFVMPWV